MSALSFEERLAALLPDEYSPSKDWAQSKGLARVEVLKELHQAALDTRELGWDTAAASSELVMQLRAEANAASVQHSAKVAALTSEVQALLAQNKELGRLLNTSRAHAASLGSVILIAESLLDDPAHEMSGADFDYGHTVHNKIKAMQGALALANDQVAQLTSEVHAMTDQLSYRTA